MKTLHIHLPETESTNLYAKTIDSKNCITLITTDHQTAGRGQRGNTWEAEKGKNLLFSLVLQPHNIPSSQQFIICELISVAICKSLSSYIPDIHIKWPNDIYYKDFKLCGILIEHDIEGTYIARTIIGIGLNVNQAHFTSDAPNPISLFQILGHEVGREALLSEICDTFTALYQAMRTAPDSVQGRDAMHRRYSALLYRLSTPALYRDAQGTFSAILRRVEPDGRLRLEDEQGTLRSYLFKEVEYIFPNREVNHLI